MQKTFIIDDEETFFKDIMLFLDWCQKEEEIVIYLNSGGWSCWKFDSALSRLERMKKEWQKIEFRVVFAGSAAFNMLYKWSWDKVLEEDADGIIHRNASIAPYMWNGNIRVSDITDRWRIEYFKNKNELEYSFVTQEEIKMLDEGFDIYINPNRMKDIFTKSS